MEEEKNSLFAFTITGQISPIHRAVQGILGIHRLRQEPGTLPGGNPAQLSESGPDGPDRSSHISDAARRNYGQSVGSVAAKRSALRPEQGRARSDNVRYGLPNAASVGG